MEQIEQPSDELGRLDRQCQESRSSIDGRKDPHERGIELLNENLSEAQRDQYAKHRFFEVIGGDSGKRYRVRHGSQMNIDEFDENGKPARNWCFFPTGDLVAGDIMLAQKTALELFERDALEIANSFPCARLVDSRLEDSSLDTVRRRPGESGEPVPSASPDAGCELHVLPRVHPRQPFDLAREASPVTGRPSRCSRRVAASSARVTPSPALFFLLVSFALVLLAWG